MAQSETGGVLIRNEDGSERARMRWTMKRTTDGRRRTVRMTQTGCGERYPFQRPVRWKSTALWLREGRFAPLSYEETVTEYDGAFARSIRRNFDWEAGLVRFRKDKAGEDPLAETLEAPRDTITVEGIAPALRVLPFSSRGSRDAHLLTDEPKLYRVTFDVEARERTETPQGPADAYRVQMKVHLGFLDLFRIFLPKTHFWFSVEEPHLWLRYEGLESSRGSPTVVRAAETDVELHCFSE